MKYLKFLALFIGMTTLSGCLSDDENYCSQTIQPYVTQVTGPGTALTGEEITINVSFGMTEGCSTFLAFYDNDVYPRTVAPAVKYEGCTCSGNAITATEGYTFSEDEPGEYELKFVNGVNEAGTAYTYIYKTITVSDPD
ncbi:hypothetical protein [Flavobacterium sp. C4GT6]|uniref:hypothetical protein n=1 Tax=Flavobacterium sp. C4GT6 TaxID=3103818 RepID=UPI002ECFAE52